MSYSDANGKQGAQQDIEELLLLIVAVISFGLVFMFINPNSKHSTMCGQMFDLLNPYSSNADIVKQ
jgi:hypothetical protein